jgi:hypothetical protein
MNGPRRNPTLAPARPSVRPVLEVVLPLPRPAQDVPTVTSVRNTILLSSRRAIETRGLLGAYGAQLDPATKKVLDHLVAGGWSDIGLARAHYEAIDRLNLSTADQLAIGGNVGMNVQNTLFAIMLQKVKGLGLSPWTGLRQYGRIWDRILVGGGVLVEKYGESDALVSMYGLPLFDVPYFRVALRGVQQRRLASVYSWLHIEVSEVSSNKSTTKFRVTW